MITDAADGSQIAQTLTSSEESTTAAEQVAPDATLATDALAASALPAQDASMEERLEWLRARFDDLKEPPSVAEGGPSEFTDVQVARRRFVLACLAADASDAQIDAAVPGFREKVDTKGRDPYWLPNEPFRLNPIFIATDEDEYLDSECRRFEAHVRAEFGRARERFAQLKFKRPAPHRKKKLDLAERYFMAVRQKILKHSYKKIAFDHIRPLPETDEQLQTAENLVKFTVRAVASEVRLGQRLG